MEDLLMQGTRATLFLSGLVAFGVFSRKWWARLLLRKGQTVAKKEASILLVEDNELTAHVMCDVIRKSGQQAKWVDSGDAALLFTDAVALVLMDFELPATDGCAVTRAIRSGHSALSSDTPVVVLTAHPAEILKDVCMQAGANGVVTKPLTLERLRDTQMLLEKGEFFFFGTNKPVGEEPLLDVKGACDFLELQESEYRELATMFLREFAEKTDAILQAAAREEFEVVARLAHSLKGECLNVGAKRCLGTLQQLIEQLHFKESDEAAPLLEQLKKEQHLTQEAVAKYLDSPLPSIYTVNAKGEGEWRKN